MSQERDHLEPGIPELKDVLEEFNKLMDMDMDVDNEWGEDVPWWYNERASLSQFAGAIWKRKGWVFEEYSTPREAETSGKNSFGRADIKLIINGFSLVAEAKQIWPSLYSKTVCKQVEKAFDNAMKQVETIPKEKGVKKAAIVFLVPKVPPILFKNKEKYEEAITNIILTLKKEKGAVAWCFKKSARGKKPKNKDYRYPGCAIIIRKFN